MSTTQNAYQTSVVKSTGHEITQKEARQAREAASFTDLCEVIEKETGLPGDRVLYRDPFGWRTSGPTGENAVYYPQKMYEGGEDRDGWNEAFRLFNKLQREGMDYACRRAASRRIPPLSSLSELDRRACSTTYDPSSAREFRPRQTDAEPTFISDPLNKSSRSR